MKIMKVLRNVFCQPRVKIAGKMAKFPLRQSRLSAQQEIVQQQKVDRLITHSPLPIRCLNKDKFGKI